MTLSRSSSNPLPLADFYRGRRVLVTGHTGFKGSWLCEWLLELGAEVTGISLEPDTEPALFNQLDLAQRVRHHIGDVRDFEVVQKVLNEARPDVIFHLAAQPLVRRSYKDPVETYQTNMVGTLNLLEALRGYEHPCSAVIVTTDKCYENTGRTDGYRENDPLGGYDPYSASKACAEIITSSYRRSFFQNSPVRIASARAGNVIGGGDWAADRIVPDCMRSLIGGQPVAVRNRSAIRPWQHVLEPLGGYLMLALHLHPEVDVTGEDRAKLDSFNFGPLPAAQRSVQDLVEEVLLHWPGTWQDFTPSEAPHEAAVLTLDISKAKEVLGWEPRWSFEAAITETVFWYRDSQAGEQEIAAMTRDQIRRYMRVLTKSSLAPHVRRKASPDRALKPIRS